MDIINKLTTLVLVMFCVYISNIRNCMPWYYRLVVNLIGVTFGLTLLTNNDEGTLALLRLLQIVGCVLYIFVGPRFQESPNKI